MKKKLLNPLDCVQSINDWTMFQSIPYSKFNFTTVKPNETILYCFEIWGNCRNLVYKCKKLQELYNK